jgi:hypothetical protein
MVAPPSCPLLLPAGLEEALKDLKGRDNILPKLMAAGSSNTDALFERELKKYDPIKADVARNVQRNGELLLALSRDSQVGGWVGGSCCTLRAGVLVHREQWKCEWIAVRGSLPGLSAVPSLCVAQVC